MKILKAKIKKSSIHYKKGLSQQGKSVWLAIAGFNPQGQHNYKIRCISSYKDGFAIYEEIWMNHTDILFRQFEDKQLSLDIFSKEEEEENKHNPRYFNQRRFEVSTPNEKRYFHAPDLKTAKMVINNYGMSDYKIIQVARLTKKQLNE